MRSLMFLVSLVALVLLPSAVFGNSQANLCSFKVNTIISLTQLKDCFDTIDVDENDAASTISKLLSYSEMFVFKEQAKYLPSDYEKNKELYHVPAVDVVQQLNNVKELLSEGYFNSDFEFQSALSGVYLPMKDPHTLYYKPRGYAYFSLIMPLTVAVASQTQSDPLSRGNSSVRFVLADVPEKYRFAKVFYQAELSKQGKHIDLNKFVDKEIESINDIPVQEAIQQFADEVSYISRNPHSRFNRVIRTDFFYRSLRVFNMPPVASLCESGDHLDSLDEGLQCSLESSNYESENLDTMFDKAGSMNVGEYRFKFVDGKELTVPLFAFSQAQISSKEDIINANKGIEPVNKYNNNNLESQSESPMLRMERDLKEMAPGSILDYKVSKDYPEVSENDDYKITHLTGGEYVILYGLTDKKKTYLEFFDDFYDAYMVIIPTFAPDQCEKYAEEAVTFADYIIEKKKKYGEDNVKLIVNVCGNGGGYITLGYRTLHLLTSTVNPLFGNYTVRKSKYSEFFSTHSSFSTQERFRLDDWYQFSFNEWYRNYTQNAIFGGEETKFSGAYTFDLAYDEVNLKKYFNAILEHESLNMKPANLYFVTDGSCGSTCACFIKRAREARAGVFLGLGGNPEISLKGIEMDVASFAGGSVMDTEFVFGDQNLNGLIESELNLTPFPTTALHRFAYEQVYSWNTTMLHMKNDFGGDYIAPAEFINNPVDDYIYYWPSPVEDSLKEEELLLTIAYATYLRMGGKHTKSGESCYRDVMELHSQNNDTHIYYGSMCVNGKYDKSKIMFLSCYPGYTLTESGSCVPQHEKWRPIKPKEPLSSGTVAGIVIAVIVALVGIAYAIMACLVCSWKKNRTYDSHFDPIRCKKPTAHKVEEQEENTALLDCEQ